MVTELTLTGVVLVALVFLSTIESAYESLSEVSLRVMAGERESSSRARFFRELIEHRRRFELILIMGTQLSIAAVAILTYELISASRIRGAIVATFVAVLSVIAIFRQLVPRLITQNNPERVLWTLLPLFRVFYVSLSIFVTPISKLLHRMRKPEEEEIQPGEGDDEAKDEIQAFIDVAEEEGIIEESEGELIQSIIEFSDTLVGDIMVPRTQIVAIESTATVADARKLIMKSKYSRIPVYQDRIDDIKGIVYVRDLLAYCDAAKLSTPVTECQRPVYFVPESKSVRALLEEMQKAKVQLAMVVDEYGGLAGLVTIEDIIEEILGEIEDEDETLDDEVVRQEDGSYLVHGRAEIRKVELLFDREVEADDFTTVAGLIINELGRVPVPGDKLEVRGLQFEVVEADEKRVNGVRIRRVEGSSGGNQR